MAEPHIQDGAATPDAAATDQEVARKVAGALAAVGDAKQARSAAGQAASSADAITDPWERDGALSEVAGALEEPPQQQQVLLTWVEPRHGLNH